MTAVIIFAVVVGVAFVVQMVALSALYRMVPEKALRVEDIVARMQQQTSSILDTAHAILEDAEPKINEITSNVAETKATVEASVEQVVETWDEITKRARAQANLLHALASRILSKRINDLGRDAHSWGGASARPQTLNKGKVPYGPPARDERAASTTPLRTRYLL